MPARPPASAREVACAPLLVGAAGDGARRHTPRRDEWPRAISTFSFAFRLLIRDFNLPIDHLAGEPVDRDVQQPVLLFAFNGEIDSERR